MSSSVFRAICQAAVAFYRAVSIPKPTSKQPSETTSWVTFIWQAWRDVAECINRLPAANGPPAEPPKHGWFAQGKRTLVAVSDDDVPLALLAKGMSPEERTALQAMGFAVLIYSRGDWSSWLRKCPNRVARMMILVLMDVAGRWAKQHKNQRPRHQISDLEKTIADAQLSMTDVLLPADGAERFMSLLQQLYQVWGEPFPGG